MQRRLTTIFYRLKLYTSVLFLFLCIHGVALAKKGEPEVKEEPINLWILGYFIVGLGITFGMLILCRSARRSDRAKPQEYKSLSTNE